MSGAVPTAAGRDRAIVLGDGTIELLRPENSDALQTVTGVSLVNSHHESREDPYRLAIGLIGISQIPGRLVFAPVQPGGAVPDPTTMTPTLAANAEAFDRAVEDRACRLLTVIGAAGAVLATLLVDGRRRAAPRSTPEESRWEDTLSPCGAS